MLVHVTAVVVTTGYAVTVVVVLTVQLVVSAIAGVDGLVIVLVPLVRVMVETIFVAAGPAASARPKACG